VLQPSLNYVFIAGGIGITPIIAMTEQLNWQPSPGAWSIGQCLEHLYITNEVYLPPLWAALTGGKHEVVREIRLGWFSRWFIRNYIAPNPAKRAKAPSKIVPANNVSPDILPTFLRSNQAVRELIARASQYDINSIRFENPFISILRFTVGTGLEILAKHQSRHLLQAEGVRRSEGFPS